MIRFLWEKKSIFCQYRILDKAISDGTKRNVGRYRFRKHLHMYLYLSKYLIIVLSLSNNDTIPTEIFYPKTA